MRLPTRQLWSRTFAPPSQTVQSDPAALHVQLRKHHSGSRASHFQLEAQFTASPGVTVIVGHSGAGKTTILHCIAGLCDPQEGRIAIGDRVLFDSRQRIRLEPARRKVAFVFQDLALFPHLSVQDNVMYGLRRLDKAERQRRMREILESFQIEHLCSRFPREISGGEQQRVALARALVTEPSVLLLDEPLSSLDPRTKVRIIEDLRRWNATHRIPALYVTHDHSEVLALGDRVIILEQGQVAAEGLPLDVITLSSRAAPAPPTEFENLFDATVVELREPEGTMVCQLLGTSILVETPLAQAAIGAEVCIGIHAGEILLAASPPAILSACNVIRGRVKQVEQLGGKIAARVGCGAEFRVQLASRAVESSRLQASTEAWMMISAQACHVVRPILAETLQRLFVFICHGNTVRSPMAQAICNAEIASRYGVPLESLDRLGIKAMSAGLTAQPGEPIAAEAEQALRAIGLPITQHRSRNLTRRLAQRAEVIFCMTEAQGKEIAMLYPETESKIYRLHPDADIGDPHNTALEAFFDLARQIQSLIRRRLDGLNICDPNSGLELA